MQFLRTFVALFPPPPPLPFNGDRSHDRSVVVGYAIGLGIVLVVLLVVVGRRVWSNWRDQ